MGFLWLSLGLETGVGCFLLMRSLGGAWIEGFSAGFGLVLKKKLELEPFFLVFCFLVRRRERF